MDDRRQYSAISADLATLRQIDEAQRVQIQEIAAELRALGAAVIDAKNVAEGVAEEYAKAQRATAFWLRLVFGLVVSGVVAITVSVIRTEARADSTAERLTVHEREPDHRGTQETLGTMRSDLSGLRGEIGQWRTDTDRRLSAIDVKLDRRDERRR